MPGFQVLSVGLALTVVPAIYRKKRNMKKKGEEEEHKEK